MKKGSTRDAGWLHLPPLIVAATWGLGLLRTLQCLVLPAHLESSLVFAAAEVPVIISAVWLITRRSAAPASSRPVRAHRQAR